MKRSTLSVKATSPTRSLLLMALKARTAASSAATSRFCCNRVPNWPEALQSISSMTVSSRSSTKRLMNGWPMRAVTFQSMVRMSSPGWYSRTSSKAMPVPLKTLRYSPPSRSSTARRARSCKRRTWRMTSRGSMRARKGIGFGAGQQASGARLLRFLCEGDAGDRLERAEETKGAREHVEIARPLRSAIRRVEGDVLRMLDEDSVAVLQVQEERAKGDLPQQPPYFGPDQIGTHRDPLEGVEVGLVATPLMINSRARRNKGVRRVERDDCPHRPVPLLQPPLALLLRQ